MFASINAFLTSGGPAPYMDVSVSGATIVTNGNYKSAIFNGSGSFTVNKLGSDSTEGSQVNYLVVAGGGGGGKNIAGGGGAGGFLTPASFTNCYSIHLHNYCWRWRSW